VRVVRVNLLLAVALAAPAIASPAHAAPVSAHAMVHTCCTPKAEKERIFSEAKALGAAYIRVDAEPNGIFSGAVPDWGGVDQVIALSKKHDLPVLAILLTPREYTDAEEYGSRSGTIAEHAGSAIDHWEVLNEPDGDWAFAGTPEEYARMLSAAHDAIKAHQPGAKVLLGGLQRPHEPGWLQRVFDTPGADAVHKFDIANVHLRGPVDAVVRRYGEFKAWLAERGFTGPLWVTEHGYSADPAFQVDRAYSAGDASQAAYLTQTLVGLGEAGAPQVFVTLHDGGLDGEYASEGLERIDETPGGDYPATRRPAFAAVRRLVDDWDQLMAWRAEQREHEQEQRMEQARAALWTSDARAARDKFREARAHVHSVQDDLTRRHLPARTADRLARRAARARALLAGRRAAVVWKSAIGRFYSRRAYEEAVAAELLRQRVAGG
jgi:hypothetical protein